MFHFYASIGWITDDGNKIQLTFDFGNKEVFNTSILAQNINPKLDQKTSLKVQKRKEYY